MIYDQRVGRIPRERDRKDDRIVWNGRESNTGYVIALVPGGGRVIVRLAGAIYSVILLLLLQ